MGAIGPIVPVGPDAAVPLCPVGMHGPVHRDGARLNAYRDRILRRWRCHNCGHAWQTRELYAPRA
jgi:transposase-like protein